MPPSAPPCWSSSSRRAAADRLFAAARAAGGRARRRTIVPLSATRMSPLPLAAYSATRMSPALSGTAGACGAPLGAADSAGGRARAVGPVGHPVNSSRSGLLAGTNGAVGVFPETGAVSIPERMITRVIPASLRVPAADRYPHGSHTRRGARVVESGGLENRCVGNPCTEGSNPSPSASEPQSRIRSGGAAFVVG